MADLWIAIVGSAFLIMLSAMFSGLTLGLMGLDKVALQVIMQSGTPQERENAAKIYPIREKGNFLLCTLLVGNVAVNALLAILLADLTGGLVGFLLSTVFITAFGEITPQAICSRYGLLVGAHTIWLVKFFMVLLFIIAWPVSKLLDRVLGDEIGQVYNKKGLRELVDISAKHKETGISPHEAGILSGALQFSEKTVKEIAVPLKDVDMVDIDGVLDEETMRTVWESGHSRIPVYESRRENIVGLLLVKDLALLNPEENASIRTFMTFYARDLPRVFSDCKLIDLLNIFKSGSSHLAVVQEVVEGKQGDPYYAAIGVVTLEDVIEEIIQDEILDETDVFVDVSSHTLNPRKKGRSMFTIFGYGKLHRLNQQHMQAVVTYLRRSVKAFSPANMSEEMLINLINRSHVVELSPEEGDKVFLYKKGSKENSFSLVLHGEVEVRSGLDEFVSTHGSWSYFAERALVSDEYVVDFDAKIRKVTRVLRVDRATYEKALRGELEMSTRRSTSEAPSDVAGSLFIDARRVDSFVGRDSTAIERTPLVDDGGAVTSSVDGRPSGTDESV
eukprot:TRINITY_DN24286_c1_g1_i1.p1 TRINITY_DN24286_c1_g1~~TRINITY_DN24286_c1_g1_i1.p1  ORF type:complete len:560 (+),score=172.06 TRINITY_DN24286_c1_g1_i1:156-1835(+)